jgi:hypothetical protein
LRFVLATNHFDGIGGSETYLLTVAEQLMRLGHGVTIYAVHLGKMAELARERGVEVAPEEDDLPAKCDVVLSQDGGVAYDLAARWPRTPQVFVCHSTLFDLQMPPLVPGVVGAVVVLSERVERRVQALDPPFHIARLRQPIDTERLVPRSTPRERPLRALLLGNYLQGERRQILSEAWASRGVEVVQVGVPTTPSLHPEEAIAGADIVVGKGRAILDAMSCGRPAYVYDAFGTDGWVTPATYPLMEADAFAGQALGRVIDSNQLRRDLDVYQPQMGLVNRDLVSNNHQARTHAEQLVDLGRKLAPASSPSTTPRRELARLVRLRWRAEGELYGLRNEFAEVTRRAKESETALSQRATNAEEALDQADREAEKVRSVLKDLREEFQILERRAIEAERRPIDAERKLDRRVRSRLVNWLRKRGWRR